MTLKKKRLLSRDKLNGMALFTALSKEQVPACDSRIFFSSNIENRFL